jgi:lipoate-protein ligase A
MGLFDLFKRDLSNDPDLTRLRDLIIISASDSNYSMDENSIILDICREEGIDIDKLQKLFKMDPEKIKDNYPTSLVEKSKYLRRLIEVMATDNVCHSQEIEALRSIAHRMGFSDEQTDGEIRDYCKGLGKKGEEVLASYEENKNK